MHEHERLVFSDKPASIWASHLEAAAQSRQKTCVGEGLTDVYILVVPSEKYMPFGFCMGQ